ncbi:fasciclin domain-containing protein [Qipengyuania sp. 1NDH17]|uniref:Fasciclin domain-containing protein n=1 Tax=Qipengyuania polymorpha TaxID=2867234 RepID=A0ABS7IWR1_9SPHN|nr:fasciclin domain-containing protein [Qipengyuania polymorpha]MBX7457982.1 fasciclin domain-containing protein [Qipengyuania polymorpha]
MKTNFTKPFVLAGAIAGLALLPACSSDADTAEPDGTTQEEATRTLAASLGDLPEMATLNGVISEAELGSIFDGPASYTLLAPNDAAFNALGEEGQALMDEEQRPVLIGLLREHILPGHLTPENIAQALETKGGDVTMTTLGGGEVTFAKDGDTITVSNGNGSTAKLAATATAATNGVIIPLDTVLVPEEEPEA